MDMTDAVNYNYGLTYYKRDKRMKTKIRIISLQSQHIPEPGFLYFHDLEPGDYFLIKGESSIRRKTSKNQYAMISEGQGFPCSYDSFVTWYNKPLYRILELDMQVLNIQEYK